MKCNWPDSCQESYQSIPGDLKHLGIGQNNLNIYRFKKKKFLFSDSKCLFLWVSTFFLEARNANIIFAEKTQMKVNSLKERKHANLIYTWSDKAFKGQ